MGTLYQVIDGRTQQVVGNFTKKQAARNKRDRLDTAHGACRYSVREAPRLTYEALCEMGEVELSAAIAGAA